MSKKSTTKKIEEVVLEKVADEIASEIKKKVTDKVIDGLIDNRQLADSLEFAEKKSAIIARNAKDTLDVADNYLKKLNEGEEALIIAQESWREQGRENQRAALKGWRDVITSLGKSVFGVVESVYEYINHFWYFGEGNKTFNVMKKDAVTTILQSEIDALKEQKKLGDDLEEQRDRELAQLEENKKKHEERAAGKDKFFKSELEFGKNLFNQEIDWEEQKHEIMIRYAQGIQKLNQKEFDIFLKYGEEGLQALMDKYGKGANDIDKAYQTTQHRGSYGLDDDKREFGYHTNTHEDQLKAMQSNYEKMQEYLSLIKEIGINTNSVFKETNAVIFAEQKQLASNTQKSKTELQTIHSDANDAIIETEEERFDRLERLQIEAAETEKRYLNNSKDTQDDAQKEQLEVLEEYFEDSVELHEEYHEEIEELQEDSQGEQLDILDSSNDDLEQSEADSHKTRIAQWQEYAEKVSAISQQVSEITSMVTNSLGGMFSQLSASYAQELESLNEKIAAVDEEKEAALERVALTEDQRRAREEELAQQKINLEYATSEEQKNKTDERIATLQGELGAEDSINRDFESKKASLEKEKEKKEKAQKKAEKMQKRLEMGQAIVEAIGNIAQGAAKALSFGPILGPILAAVVSAAGAIQVGVMTKQLAKMEDGGLLRGKRHSAGGMRIQGSNIEVEGGEYVVNRQTTQKNLGLMNYINSQHKELSPTDINSYFSQPFSVPTFSSPFSAMMEQGGQVPMLPLPTNADTQQILQAIGDINFQPRVAITDIHHAEQQMARVDEWTGM